MPYTSPAWLRRGAAAAEAPRPPPPPPPPPPAALATSVYETHLGLVALSWSRYPLGLSLGVDLLLSSPSPSPSDDDDDDDDDDEALHFRIRPWLLWKRRGSKRFPLKRHRRHRFVDFAWDLTRARFAAGAPEPAAGYFVSAAVDGEIVLVAGDLRNEAHGRSKSLNPSATITDRQTLISRREHVVIGDPGASRTYRTAARLGGREREIAIELGASPKTTATATATAKEKEKGRGLGEVGMFITVDGNCVLNVPRLRWAFRGSETVAAEGGGRIRVSWDLHNWLFRLRGDSAVAPTAFGDSGDAVFIFRFEPGGGGDGDGDRNFGAGEGHCGNKGGDFAEGGYFGKRNGRNWSDGGGSNSSSSRGRRKRSLLKASSSSSVSVSSTASTASTSTVAGWASPEEAEMQRGDVFSLLVCAWRS